LQQNPFNISDVNIAPATGAADVGKDDPADEDPLEDIIIDPTEALMDCSPYWWPRVSSAEYCKDTMECQVP